VVTGKGNNEVERLLRFLESYVVTHFGSEERAMLSFAYPDYEFHLGEHEAFKKSFAKLKKEFELQGVVPQLTIKLQKSLVDWLIAHIGKVDKRLAGFLKDKSDVSALATPKIDLS
jgi:hemerythrin